MRSRYLIAALSDASIILMLGYGGRSGKIQASSEPQIDILPVETDRSANSRFRFHNPLSLVDKVNLRTLDNVFSIWTELSNRLLIKARPIYLVISQLNPILDRLNTCVSIHRTTIM